MRIAPVSLNQNTCSNNPNNNNKANITFGLSPYKGSFYYIKGNPGSRQYKTAFEYLDTYSKDFAPAIAKIKDGGFLEELAVNNPNLYFRFCGYSPVEEAVPSLHILQVLDENFPDIPLNFELKRDKFGIPQFIDKAIEFLKDSELPKKVQDHIKGIQKLRANLAKTNKQ